jgi:hypothetical protein
MWQLGQLVFAVVLGTLIEHVVEELIAWCRALWKKKFGGICVMESIRLEPINFADLESPDLSVRLKANQTIADNERRVYARITQATEAVLRSLGVEAEYRPSVGNSDSSPARS